MRSRKSYNGTLPIRESLSWLIALCVSALATAARAATPFVIEIADAGAINDSVGEYSSIAVDANGNRHVSYYRALTGDLMYARKSGAAWTVERADGSASIVGLFTSIAVDAQGNPHVTYYDETFGDLKYARRSGGVWTVETADASANDVGKFTSLSLDTEGNPRVSYFDDTINDLKYARKSAGVWTVETADGSANVVGLFTSIALDTQGNPHVSYEDGSASVLKYARKVGGVWTTEVADASPIAPRGCSLALDAQGNPHISYTNISLSQLIYARKSGGVWAIQKVDSLGAPGFIGTSTSLALDAQGDPHVACVYSGQALYASKFGGVWTVQGVEGAGGCLNVRTVSLALDAIGNTHISFDCFPELRYGFAAPLAWTSLWHADEGIYPDVNCPWVLTDAAEPEAPSLSNGVLALPTSANDEYMYYRQNTFLAFPDTLRISARVRLVSETRTDNNPRRGLSIAFVVAPDSGNFLAVGRDTVFLRSAYEVQGPMAFVDTDDAFHTYDIKVVNRSAITVYQDNVQILTGSIFGSTGFGSTPNIRWGDENVSASAVSEWEFVRHNASTVQCGIPVDVSSKPRIDSSSRAFWLVAYPNPSRGPITFAIRSEVSRPTPTQVRVYDTSGRLVRSIEAGTLARGLTRLDWNGTDDAGRSVASGTYFWRLESEGRHVGTSKVTLLR
ncbi:MAG: FlgD immunoglobulin-like domain containing protein [bacterium]